EPAERAQAIVDRDDDDVALGDEGRRIVAAALAVLVGAAMDPEEDRQRLAAVVGPIGWNIDVEKKAVLAVGAARNRDRVWRCRKRDRVAELGDVLRTGSAKLRRGVGILRRTIESWRIRRRPSANSGGQGRVT